MSRPSTQAGDTDTPLGLADSTESPLDLASRLRTAVSAVRWYCREVTGEAAYDRYVEHARAGHPAAAVLSRREFERARQDRVNRRPQQRCC